VNVIDLTLDELDDQHATPVQDKEKMPIRYQLPYSDTEDSDGDVFEGAIDDSILML
jgi:hypothetical protein